MHYYQFNIGDYASHTSRLSPMEDLAYRRLLDLYYLNEQPLSGCSTYVAREIGLVEHVSSVEYVLSKFFTFENDCYKQKRIDIEIKKYKSNARNKSKAGKASAKARQTKAKSESTPVEQPLNTEATDEQLNINQEPRTKNHKPVIKDMCEDAFQLFYSAGLPKKNPKGARDKFSLLIKKMKCDPMELAETLKQDIQYRLSTGEFGFNKLHPATYLNKERWLDEYETAKQGNNGHAQVDRKLSASERIRAANELKYGSQQPSSGLGMAANGRDLREPMDQGEWREAIPHVEDRS